MSLILQVIELYKETFGVNYSLPRLLGGCFIVTDDSVQVSVVKCLMISSLCNHLMHLL